MNKFSLKKTLLHNIGLLAKTSFTIVLFIIGLNVIVETPDFTTHLFLTLIWCYMFIKGFRFSPSIIYVNKKGQIAVDYNRGRY